MSPGSAPAVNPAARLRAAPRLHMLGRRAAGPRGDMMASNRLFDDFARLVTDATGAAQGVRREMETAVKAQFERFIRDMDVATREEVEVLRDMVSTLKLANDALAARVNALEGHGPHGSADAGQTGPAIPAN